MKRAAFTAALFAMAASALPASACVISAEPRLPGESAGDYQSRVEAMRRKQAFELLQRRQAHALEHAQRIFIGRHVAWTPPVPPAPAQRVRPGQPPVLAPTPIIPAVEFPAPADYAPVAWFRGTRSADVFRVRGSNTSCGPMRVGDTTNSAEGALYVFFARTGPLSEQTIIDAIRLDAIDHPGLVAFVSRHRNRPAAQP